MSDRRRIGIRPVVGFLLWGAGAAFVLYLLFSPDGAAHEPARRVTRFMIDRPRTLVVTGPAASVLRRGDAVFIEDDAVFLRQVGSVEKISEGGNEAWLLIYPEHAALLTEGVQVRAFTVPGTAAWVIGTLLPPKRLAAIQQLTSEFIAVEGDAIREALWPEVRRALLDLLTLYEKELPAALAPQSDRWDALLKRHRDGVVKEELGPVLEEVSFALAKEKFQPLLEEVGEKLWKALPVWSLGWKAVWQEVPLTNENQVRRRFEKYVEEDAAPILEEYAGPATKLAGEVIGESLKDPRVRAALGKVFREVASDPEFAALARDLLKELVIENEELRALMRERWEAGLRDAVVAAAGRLEPLIRRIVDSVVLDESRSAINPRLARVLRAKVFMKDRRWALLAGGHGADLAEGAKIAGEVARD